SPGNRPYEAAHSALDLKQVTVSGQGRRATVSLHDLQIGNFYGDLELTLYAGASLIHSEAVVHTREEGRAILYDSGLMLPHEPATRFAWLDTEGKLQRITPAPSAGDRHLAVRHRMLIAETDNGSIACFPPPHQLFFPRDLTENLRTVWYGRGH